MPPWNRNNNNLATPLTYRAVRCCCEVTVFAETRVVLTKSWRVGPVDYDSILAKMKQEMVRRRERKDKSEKIGLSEACVIFVLR